MTLTRRWSTGAAHDLEAGVAWYDERWPGLGAEFATEVFATVDLAMKQPLLVRCVEHPDIPEDRQFRKVQLRRFSTYGLVYTLVDDIFWIIAVAHERRRPAFWIGRTSELLSTRHGTD